MDDGNLYHVYQADRYDNHYPRIIRAESAEAAKEIHKDHWREMFDKPPDANPPHDTYAIGIDPCGLDPGEIIEL